MLWTPMMLSSISLTVANPGFTIGYEPNKKPSGCKTFGLVLVDLLLFLLHPTILQFQISSLRIQNESIKKSLDLNQSPKYTKNLEKIIKKENQLFTYKRLELNLETIFQMTASLLLYLYAQSETTTTNSLKAVFDTEKSNIKKSNDTWCDEKFNSNLLVSLNIDYIPCIQSYLPAIDPIYIVIFNFLFSFLSYTK